MRVGVTLHYPADWPESKVAAMNDMITSNPGALFNAAFLAAYGVTGVEAALDASTPQRKGARAPAAFDNTYAAPQTGSVV